MIVSLDLGNSNPHIGIQKQGMIETVPLASFDGLSNSEITFYAAVVGKNHSFLENKKIKRVNDFKKNKTFIDMKIQYSESLGEDRLINAHYIYQKYSNLNSIIIDAGTFITIDLVNANGFQGGFIFPGIKVFLESYSKGSLLPVTPFQLRDKTSLPHDTDSAILEATNLYLKSITENCLNQFPHDQIILTGGSADILEKLLSQIQFKKYPNLIHEALFNLAKLSGEKI